MSTHSIIGQKEQRQERLDRITHFIVRFVLFEKCRPRREAVANNVNIWAKKLENADPYPKELCHVDTVMERERREFLSSPNQCNQ